MKSGDARFADDDVAAATDTSSIRGMLSADELLAGGALHYDIEVPSYILQPDQVTASAGKLRIKPLTVRDLQLISRAAKDNDALMSALMVQTALVEPALTLPQVHRLHVGLMQFLLDEINRISGISVSNEALQGYAEDPLVKAAFVLAREFGWTPEQVSELTLGQIMLNLQLLKEKQGSHG
jgi:hypothetical protein